MANIWAAGSAEGAGVGRGAGNGVTPVVGVPVVGAPAWLELVESETVELP